MRTGGFSALTLVLSAAVACSDATRAEDARPAPASFTHGGAPVHPELVRRCLPGLADGGPPAVVAVELVSPELPVEIREGDVLTRPWEEGSFAYRHLGTLGGDIHVLRTFLSGGGSGVFQDLAFFRIEEQPAWFDGPRRRHILVCLGIHGLGDRSRAEVDVSPERVTVGDVVIRAEDFAVR